MDDLPAKDRAAAAQDPVPVEDAGRRAFLARFATVSMAAAMTAAYGTLAAFIVRFLYPARPSARGWLFVREVDAVEPGGALSYELPDGSPVTIRRQGEGRGAEDFMALSSTCPHLGCQVHWQAANRRFFCPCHNGVFTPDGVAVSGPPAEAKQSLPRYPLRVSGGLLYIQAPLTRLASARRPGG